MSVGEFETEVGRGDVRELTWDAKKGVFVPKAKSPRRSSAKEQWWNKAYYEPSLDIAKGTRNALVAVMAIIRSRNKGQPFEFGNVVMKDLGFGHTDKNRALRQLEAVGYIKVKWRDQKSPLVRVIKAF